MARSLSTLEQPGKAASQSSSPIVIGGFGGSGTRVVVSLLQAAGVIMGSRLNGSPDLLDFVPLFDALNLLMPAFFRQACNLNNILELTPEEWSSRMGA